MHIEAIENGLMVIPDTDFEREYLGGFKSGVTVYGHGCDEVECLRLIKGHVPEYKLTRRQREIQGLVDQKLKSREIAERLLISRRTVEKHRSNICRKRKGVEDVARP